MIASRTLRLIRCDRLFVAFLLLAMPACREEIPDPEAPEPEPTGEPAVRFLVDHDPADDGEGFVDASEARYSDPFTLLVSGMAPGATVEIVTTASGLASRATFIASKTGDVDLRRDAPVDGSWTGVDAEGPLWSMSGQQAPGRLDLTVQASAIVDDIEVAGASLARRFVDDGIVVEPVNSGRTVGALALPPGDGPFPAVLVFGGSEGGSGSGVFTAMILAQRGFAALGVAYFGEPGVPNELVEVPLEILEEGLAFLAADARIDADRLAVMGGSRGGELALLVGATFPVVKAVVATVPSGVVWGGLSTSDEAAWTLAGAPIPFVPDAGGAIDVDTDANGAAHLRFRRAFVEDLERADSATLDAATIKAENISGPVLLLAGEDDQLWPSCPMAEIAFARLQATPGRFGDERHCYAGAGHNIAIPGWSTIDSVEYFRADVDGYMVLGGTPQANARGGRDADTAIRRFLASHL
jgi:dienelactone hydrolase